MDTDFELRHISYFQNKNIFLGSCAALRYRLEPKGEVIVINAWKDDRCFEQQEASETTEVPLSEAGLVQAIEWLQSQR